METTKKHSLVYLLCSIVILLACLLTVQNVLSKPVRNSNSHMSYSYDNKYKLMQSVILKNEIHQISLKIINQADQVIEFTDDSSYRAMDFKFAGWGINANEMWAVSGDIGIYCYTPNGEHSWVKYTVPENVKSTDSLWVLQKCDNNSATISVPKSSIPEEVIKKQSEWEK